MKLAIDIPAETYKAISEWDEPKTKYAAEYMLYQFVKNGKRIEQTNCSDAISRTDAIRVASGYCHWTNIPDELAKLPSVNPKPCEMTAEEYRQRMIQAFHNADCDELISVCVLPTEKEFENLEWLLKNHYKKEPCEDAISRVAAIDKLDEWDWQEFYLPIHFKELLDELPPVSVAEKTGRWKRRIVDSGYNADWSCSCCGYKVKTDFVNFKYCPSCGAFLGGDD